MHDDRWWMVSDIRCTYSRGRKLTRTKIESNRYSWYGGDGEGKKKKKVGNRNNRGYERAYGIKLHSGRRLARNWCPLWHRTLVAFRWFETMSLKLVLVLTTSIDNSLETVVVMRKRFQARTPSRQTQISDNIELSCPTILDICIVDGLLELVARDHEHENFSISA